MERNIVREVPEKRERYVKHFRMAQKGMAAAVYPTPVHYEENGVWKEIDNRLEPVEQDGKEVYQNHASAVRVTFAGEAGDGKAAEELVTVEKDGLQIRWGLETGAALQQAERIGKAGRVRTGSAADRTAAEPMGTAEEARSVEKKKACRFRVLTEPEVYEEPGQAELQEAWKAEAATAQAAGVTFDTLSEEQIRGELGVPHLTSEGIYEEILPGVDLHYAVQGERIKENIRLKTKEAAALPLVFCIRHPGLKMQQEEDGSLGLYRAAETAEDSRADSEQVYEFVKPYMYDGAGNRSQAVDFHLETGGEAEEERSRIRVVPDAAWLQAKERVYPVVIDPMTETSKTPDNIEDTYIFSGGTDTSEDPSKVYAYGSVAVGRSDGFGKSRALLRFKNLPTIGNGSIIYAATMYIWQYQYSTYGIASLPIYAQEVKSSWEEKTVRWNNQPGVEAAVLDYKEVSQVQNGNVISITPIGFDVTKLVRQWYNTGKNYGILLRSKYEDDAALANRAYARFYTSNYPQLSSDQYPSGVFYYRNVNGLEDYQSYHEQDCGRGGTGYTNDFTGNLVWIHPDAETEGSLQHAVIRHVYNSSESGTASRMGYGWRLSCMQEIKPTGMADYPYVYIDEDGTKHYFYKDTEDGNKLKDEDGLGLTITATSGEDYNHALTIETKEQTKYIFGGEGFLRFIEDADGNQVSYVYGPNTYGNFFGYATDMTGGRLDVVYAADASLSRLTEIKDMAGRSLRYTYDDQGNLAAITYPDGKQTAFTYDAAHKLLSVTNPDGYRVTYTYADDFRVPRVSRILETGTGNKAGQELKISYENGNTTVFEEPGLDGELGQTADNRKTTYHFDNMGRPTDILDSDGYANNYTYYASGRKNHKLSTAGRVQKTVYGLLKNPLLGENHRTGGGWYVYRSGDGTKSVPVYAAGYAGTASAKLVKTAAASEEGICQDVELQPGTYTLSAYLKTEGMGAAAGTDSGAGLMVLHGDGSKTKGTLFLRGNTDPGVDEGWERLSLTFRLTQKEKVTVFAGLSGVAGTLFVSGVQLEEGSAANPLNLMNNPGFEIHTDGAPVGWKYKAGMTGEKTSVTGDRGRCLVIHGETGQELHCHQIVDVSGKAGEVYQLSCWVQGTGIPEKRFAIAAAILYEGLPAKWHYFPCNPNVKGWQFVSGTFRTDDGDPAKDSRYTSIHVYVFYEHQANQALFDGIQLTRDDGESYTYDTEGNLTDAVSAAEKTHFVNDKKGSVTRMGNIDGTAFEYGYDTKHHLVRANNSEGIRYTFDYNAKGQPVKLTAEGGTHLGAVTPGRIYYLREKSSGHYMEVRNGSTQAGAVVQLHSFTGNAEQKWKAVDGKDGYISLEPQHAKGRYLALKDASAADGAAIQLYSDSSGDARKWKLHPKQDGSCQISCKGTQDKKGLTNGPKSTADGQAVQSYLLAEGNVHQDWYLEPADEGTPSVSPADGKVVYLRVRQSGQYLDVDHLGTAAGTKAIQQYYNGGRNQQFRLTKQEGQYYLLEPLHAAGMVLAKSGKNADGYDRLALEKKTVGAANQLFRFEETESGKGTGYAIVCKDGNAALDVMHYSYTCGEDVILTAHEGVQLNKWWILEECSDRIESSMAYTSDGRQVESVTDARGNVTRYTYDARNRLLTKVMDAAGNAASYTYDANTDQLTEVKQTVNGTEVKASYTYVNDRLSSITRNGFSYQYAYDAYGNQTAVSVGGKVLEQTAYRNRNGLTDRITYATGEAIRNAYDTEERLISQYLVKADGSETKLFTNTYDNYGNVAVHQDHLTGIRQESTYDLIGRTTGISSSDGGQIRIGYDEKNRVASLTQKADTSLVKTTYLYGDVTKQQKPGLLYGLEVNGTERVSYTYDALGRLTKRTLHPGNTVSYETAYEFLPGAKTGTTTTLVSGVRNGSSRLSYTYDALGNIRTVSENGVLKCTYHYDALHQLIREDSVWENQTICYTYDQGGNLKSQKEYAYTAPGSSVTGTPTKQVSYTYGNTAWKDQLTAYNGQTITYDAMGNPLSYRGMTLTWEKGRELKQAVKGSQTVAYVYNSEGMRTKKTVGGITTTYYVNGNQILGIKKGSELLQFVYDQNGSLVSLEVNGKSYYYLHNVQNDVIGLIDSSGEQVVSYRYNSWGRLLSMTDTTTEKIGEKNPFRYREYCWDEETSLYYVTSRYYDPETGRFISADDVDVLEAEQDSLQQYNLYTYCLNNPVNRTDDDGHLSIPNWAKVTIGAVATIAAVGLTVATGGAALPVLAGVAASTLSGAAIGYVTGGKEGAINGAIDGFMWGGIGAFASSAVGAVKTVREYKKTVDTYGTLKKQYKGTGKEVHHIVEQRLARPYKVATRKMPSVALDKATHRIYTNKWRKEIAYGTKYTPGLAYKYRLYKASNAVYKRNRVLKMAARYTILRMCRL